MNGKSLLLGAVGLLALAASGQAQEVKLGYINKMGDHPWFVAEVAGAKAKAKELGQPAPGPGRPVRRQPRHHHHRHLIGDGVKGIAIVVPDKALGPVVAKKAKEAGIPLIAVDDDITYKDGSRCPMSA